MEMRRSMMLILLFCSTVSVHAQQLYTVEVNSSKVKWKATKVIGGGHHGTVNLASGQVAVNDKIITGGEFIIDMNTISAEELGGKTKMLEGHLRSQD